MNYLWVVEMLIRTIEWGPTLGVAFTKNEVRDILRILKSDNPDDKFRLVKYVPEKDAGKEGE